MTSKIAQGQFNLDEKDTFRRAVDDIWGCRSGILYATKTQDFSSALDAGGATATITVPGAELGDFALASLGVSMTDALLTAYVSAPDTVSVRFQNESGATFDPASTTLRAIVIPRRSVNTVFGSSALFGSATVDVASLVDAAGATSSSITVTGAALGDFVLWSHGVDVAGFTVSAYVSAADTVKVRFQNESGGTVDLASATTRVVVIPAATAMAQVLAGTAILGAVTQNPSSLVDGAGETATVTVGGAALGDFVLSSFSLDLSDITVVPYVHSAHTVKVRFQNESTGTLDLASGTLRSLVLPRSVIETFTTQQLSK